MASAAATKKRTGVEITTEAGEHKRVKGDGGASMPPPVHETSRASLLAESIEDALDRFRAQEVVIVPLPVAERMALEAALQKTDLLGWVNRLYKPEYHIPSQQISMEHLTGKNTWPFTKTKMVKFPNAQSGMLNVYWSPVHETALALPTIRLLFDVRTGTTDWVIDHNRFRLAQPGTGGTETVHTDHSCLDVHREAQPASILSLSQGRTFCWYRGTSKVDKLQKIQDTYRSTLLSAGKHYVTFDLDKRDPLSLKDERTVVQLEFGDVLIFNDNLVHEVAANDSKRAQLSIFLSPRNPAVKPQPTGPPLTKLTPYQLKMTAAQHYFDASIEACRNTTLFEAQQCSWLLGVSPPMWPSGKLSFLVHSQANKTYATKFAAHALADSTATAGSLIPFEPLPPQTVHVTAELLAQCETTGITIPAAARRLSHWHRDPTLLASELQRRLGFRAFALPAAAAASS